jgi:hypothetical protein
LTTFPHRRRRQALTGERVGPALSVGQRDLTQVGSAERDHDAVVQLAADAPHGAWFVHASRAVADGAGLDAGYELLSCDADGDAPVRRAGALLADGLERQRAVVNGERPAGVG